MKYYAFLFIFISWQSIAQWNPSNPLLASAEDCPVATRICNATQEYNFQLSGDGLIDDANGSLSLITLPQTSPTQFESKICWVKFTPQYSGDLAFVICPENLERLQFQLWKNYDCTVLNVNNPGLTYAEKSDTNITTWSSDLGCTGLGYTNNPYNPTLESPNFLNYSEPLIAGTNYLLVIHTRLYNQIGTHRFTLRFTGPVVTAHPDVFYHPDCNLSTEEVVINDNIVAISPNPFTTTFTINTLLPYKKLALYDVTGKLVHTQNYQNKVEIKNLSQGVYFLHLIDSEGNKVVKKLVKE